jgi:hypothetical protein
MGYKTSNWVVNMGSSQYFLAIMIVQLITIPLILRCWKCSRCLCVKDKLERTKQELMWNGIIRFFIELFFELSLICVIRLKTHETDTIYEKAFTYSAAAVFGGLVLFNYCIAVYLTGQRRNAGRRRYDERFGTLWEGLDTRNRVGFFSVPFFLFCRLLFVCVLVLVLEQDLVTF